jgi:hypothetical protein
MLRRYALGAFASVGAMGLLTACGGGSSGSPPPVQMPATPTVERLASDKPSYFVGESAEITAVFRNGSGRIDPGIGPVQSGVPVSVSQLAETRELTLTVESATGKTTRTLSLPVSYRDRYRVVATGFSANGHTATLDLDGNVILIGGSRGTGTLSTRIDRFDDRTGTLTKIGDLSNGRERHRAALLNDGRILVVGGLRNLAGSGAEIVDPRTGTVAATGTPRVSRLDHSITRLGDGRVLILGGRTASEGAVAGISRSAEIWEPQTGEFRLLGTSLNMARTSHTATLLANGKVLVAGGFTADATYSSVEVFDPATENFVVLRTVINPQRALHIAAQLPDLSVLLLGGENNDGTATASVLRIQNDADPGQTLANLLQPRTFADAAVTRGGSVYVFGGEVGQAGAVTNSAEVYSAATGAAAIAGLPQPRFGMTATALRSGRILIAGGENAQGLAPTALVYE